MLSPPTLHSPQLSFKYVARTDIIISKCFRCSEEDKFELTNCTIAQQKGKERIVQACTWV
jgi:hypothetical protein